MTRPHHEWAGPWRHPPRKPDRRPPWLAIWAFTFALAGLCIAALAGSPAPDMPHGPGWELCGKEWRC